jgi:hypothetical protein
LIFVGLFVLPFLDRGGERRLASRPKFVLLGIIFVVEIAVLTYWGKVGPVTDIPDEQAAFILGGVALLVAAVFVVAYKLMFWRLKGKLSAGLQTTTTLQKAQIWTGALFTGLLVGGALAISASISSVVQVVTQGMTGMGLLDLAGSVGAVGLVVLGTIYLLYRLDLANGTIKTRIPAFEVGWPNEE